MFRLCDTATPRRKNVRKERSAALVWKLVLYPSSFYREI